MSEHLTPRRRWLRFNGSYNGFNECVIAVGAKVAD